MSTPARPRAEFADALNSGALRMEQSVVSAGLLLTTLGFCVALAHSLLTFPRPAVLALAGAFLGWEALALGLLRRGSFTRVLPWLNPVIESAFPTAMLIVETTTVGGRASIFFSSVPIFYLDAVLLSVVRLRVVAPLLSSAVGALGYATAVYLLALPAAVAQGPVTRDEVVFLFMRTAFILLGGVVGSFVVLSLRKVSGQAHSQLRAQELFGKYRVGEEIASGGMGVVMRATYCPEGGFERDVAMKRIHAHLMKDERLVSSFRAEAELSARMLHPNIVQVLDFGRVDQTWFYAMEYVEGFTLMAALRASGAAGKPFPLSLLAYVAREVCAGLEYAHRGALGVDGKPLNVVHRDLTPSNVLLAGTGQVKIADFGVAKALKGASALHTQTLAGKLPYMAPEQASGGAVDGRTDLFTLGIVLWESIAMKMLFYREEEGAVLHAVLNMDVPKPSTVRPDLPPAWDAVVMKALSRDPAARFATAHAMGEAIAALDPAGPAELAAYLATLPRKRAVELATPGPVGLSQATVKAPANPTAVTTPHR